MLNIVHTHTHTHTHTVFTAFAYKALVLIPISVALGVFYYLAYASIKGVQLATRIKLLFVPPKHHPKAYFVQKVQEECLLKSIVNSMF